MRVIFASRLPVKIHAWDRAWGMSAGQGFVLIIWRKIIQNVPHIFSPGSSGESWIRIQLLFNFLKGKSCVWARIGNTVPKSRPVDICIARRLDDSRFNICDTCLLGEVGPAAWDCGYPIAEGAERAASAAARME